MVLHRATCSDDRIGGVSDNVNHKGVECIPAGGSATGEGNVFSMGNVLNRKESGTTDEGMTMGIARRMACTASNSRDRNGDARSSVDTRNYSRRRRVRLRMVACRYAGRRDPCRRDDGRGWNGRSYQLAVSRGCWRAPCIPSIAQDIVWSSSSFRRHRVVYTGFGWVFRNKPC
jgi:hypothetical protein